MAESAAACARRSADRAAKAKISCSQQVLPGAADDDVPMVMVGPRHGRGAIPGVPAGARVARGQGRNWLFFGDQHRAHDFAYETRSRAGRSRDC